MPENTADVQILKGKKFVSGVYVMTLSTIIVKIIGLVYKIPMLKLIGSIGMGYFNSAYEIYASFCVISTSGLPVAMSLLIAGTEDKAKRQKIFKVSFFAFLIVGLVCMALILGLAYPFSVFLGSRETYLSLLCISPAILFICLCSAIRGYFQGLSRMVPTALSQIIEASGKLMLGLLFAGIGMKIGLGLPQIAGMAVLGLTLSEGIALIYLLVSKGKSDRGDCDESEKKIFFSLMKTTLPITFSASILSITKLIDMTMIFRRLGSLGYGSNLVNSIYGSYTTLAIPLFSLAPALVSGVALPLIPAISSARAEGNIDIQNQTANRAFKLTSLISSPIGVGLVLFSTPILQMIFSGQDGEINMSAPLLSILGLSVLMSCFITVQNALLQAYSKPNLPIISMVAGSVLKIILCYVLVGNPSVHIYGIPISTFVCDFAISTMNFYFLSKHTPLKFMFSDFLIKPYLCAILSCACGYMIFEVSRGKIFTPALHTLCCTGICGLLYAVLLFVTKTFDKKEAEILLLKKQNT